MKKHKDISCTILPKEGKQDDRGSNITRRNMIREAHVGKRRCRDSPFAIDVKGGENVERARILPSMTKGEIVG